MAARKIKISECREVKQEDNRMVICPMSRNLTIDDNNGGYEPCQSNCAWFRIIGTTAYCKEAEIGELDEQKPDHD
jgi:hypothetical protein